MHTFETLVRKARVKSEFSHQENPSRMDVRLPIPQALLQPIWEKILELSADIPNTNLPPDAFATPTLVISDHNTKLSTLSWDHATFAQMRAAFFADYDQRWNTDYIVESDFWLDVGQKISSTQGGTTCIRKAPCNQY